MCRRLKQAAIAFIVVCAADDSCVHGAGTRRLMKPVRFGSTWERRAHWWHPGSLVRRLSLESHRVAVARRDCVLADANAVDQR